MAWISPDKAEEENFSKIVLEDLSRNSDGFEEIMANNFGGLDEKIDQISERMYEDFPPVKRGHAGELITEVQDAVAEMGLHYQPLDEKIDRAVDSARILAG